MSSELVAAALNRVADALFQQSKALKRSADASTQAIAISTEMLIMQKANLAVTKQLEAQLIMQTSGESDGPPV